MSNNTNNPKPTTTTTTTTTTTSSNNTKTESRKQRKAKASSPKTTTTTTTTTTTSSSNRTKTRKEILHENTNYDKLDVEAKKKYLLDNSVLVKIPTTTQYKGDEKVDLEKILDEKNIETFTCSICMCVVDSQSQCTNGHLACDPCWNSILNSNQSKCCPFCKVVVTKETIDRNLFYKTILNKEEVQCPFYLDENDSTKVSCGTMTYGHLVDTHKNVCQYRKILCTCGTSVKMTEIDTHTRDVCKETIFICNHCKSCFKRFHQEHHFTTCQKMPIRCKLWCKIETTRETMAKHIEDVCPNTKIPCPFVKMGCKDKFQRSTLAHHISLYNCHSNLIQSFSETSTSLKVQNERILIRNSILQQQIDNLQRENFNQNSLQQQIEGYKRANSAIPILTEKNRKLEEENIQLRYTINEIRYRSSISSNTRPSQAPESQPSPSLCKTQ